MNAGEDAQDRLEAWRAEIAAARRPAELLSLRLDDLAAAASPASDAAAARLFESIFWRLPPFADDWLPLLAAGAYARLGREDPAFLLASLAVQMQPAAPASLAAYEMLHARFLATGRGSEAAAVAARLRVLAPGIALPVAPPCPADAPAEEAARIAVAPDGAALLLGGLELRARGGDWAGAARLFEAAFHRLPPLVEYWVYCRMAEAYAELGRPDAAALLAALSVQLDPEGACSFAPFARLFHRFEQAGRRSDAVELARRLRARRGERPMPGDEWLAPLLAAAGPPAAPPDARVRRDLVVVPGETRAAKPFPVYGGAAPAGLVELLQDMPRDPVVISELLDAEVLIWSDAVAVFSRDGSAQADLSVGAVPALVRRRLDDAQRNGRAVEEAAIDAAVLACDIFPAPNPCHFLLDQASRVLLYRRAGVDLAQVAVIGPELRIEYQRATAERLGVRSWRGSSVPARLRVGRLWVSSNCRGLRHPAHWGAAWAIDPVRALFGPPQAARGRRLLISREDSPYRRIGNAAEVAALLQPCGFEVIVPGRLPFAAQIAAFRAATHVVGPHGAALANTLFCAPGTHVLEAFHPHYGSWAYAILGQALDLDYAALLGRDALSDAAEFNDPALPLAHRDIHAGRDMRVDPAELERWLADSGAR